MQIDRGKGEKRTFTKTSAGAGNNCLGYWCLVWHAYLVSHSRAEGGKGTYPSSIWARLSSPCKGSCCCSGCLGLLVEATGARGRGNPVDINH